MTNAEYIRQSLETNLFFLRIIKEHIIFAAAALTLKDSNMVPSLMQMKDQAEQLLMETVILSKGIITPLIIGEGDVITPYTYKAEIATQNYTGLPINTQVTIAEATLLNNVTVPVNPSLEQQVSSLNRQAIASVTNIIQTKKTLLSNVLSCRMFTSMYPLMIEHVINEAEHYLEHLQTLQNHQSLHGGPQTAAKGEIFWNTIMNQHAAFIRGMLDPTEEELMQKANVFAEEFGELVEAAKKAYDQLALLPGVTQRSINAVTEIRSFKAQGTQGILECKIRSIILPLLSDHVLREANHYLKELKEFQV